jgi:ferrous iron transport protein A
MAPITITAPIEAAAPAQTAAPIRAAAPPIQAAVPIQAVPLVRTVAPTPAIAPSQTDIRLADLAPGTRARVVSVSAADAAAPLELGRRLAELGFLPGEAVRIVARGLMARAPIAVRIGTGTFALRLFEAACSRVRPELPPLG